MSTNVQTVIKSTTMTALALMITVKKRKRNLDIRAWIFQVKVWYELQVTVILFFDHFRLFFLR